MPRTITQSEMESRGRIARLQSALTDAVASVDGVTYHEVLIAMTRAAHRWAEDDWRTEFQTGDQNGSR